MKRINNQQYIPEDRARDADSLILSRLITDADVKEVPWGRIFNSNAINNFSLRVVEQVKVKDFGVSEQDFSVSLGVMQPNATHRPYVRLIDNSIEEQSRIFYVIVTGELQYYDEGKGIVTKGPGYTIEVKSGNIFGFQAGESGASFVMIMFPAFEPHQFINEL